MDFDILDQVLTKLNRRCQSESRSALLLLDNASCHPYYMKGKYPNNNCVFFSSELHLEAPAFRFGDYSILQAKVRKADDDSRGQPN